MNKTSISWCDYTWNPVTGCSRGCWYCYAKKMAERFAGRAGYPNKNPFQPLFHPERLEEPLKKLKPSSIFVASMGDLFDPAHDLATLDKIFSVIAACPQHTFWVLTKQPRRMAHYFTEEFNWEERLSAAYQQWSGDKDGAARVLNEITCEGYNPPKGRANLGWPMKNLLLGVTAENQEAAEERIPSLLKTPAQHLFVSLEPLMGEVQLRSLRQAGGFVEIDALQGQYDSGDWIGAGTSLDLVIAGGMTGGYSPMRPEWVRKVRDDCMATGISFHFKQWGKPHPRWPLKPLDNTGFNPNLPDGGNILDGRTWPAPATASATLQEVSA